MTGVHQVVAGAAPYDAITHHVLESRRVIRDMGLRSEVFCDDRYLHPALAGQVHPASAWGSVARPGDGAVLHYSIASPVFREVAGRASRCALYYQNITPPALLWRDAPLLALECARGLAALPGLAPLVVACAGNSAFTAADLARMGFPDPLPLGILRPPLPPAPPRVPAGPGEGIRMLFVGRGVPNKAQHHLLLALASLRQAGVEATLTLVGAWGAAPQYERRCRTLARDLRLGGRVRFAGSVDDAALSAAYASADCFVCLSDHEGFCVPVMEAMNAGLPIVAFAAAAVPETLGDAGLLLPVKPPSLVAEAVAEVAASDALRARMAAARPAQLERLSPARIAAGVRELVRALS